MPHVFFIVIFYLFDHKVFFIFHLLISAVKSYFGLGAVKVLERLAKFGHYYRGGGVTYISINDND